MKTQLLAKSLIICGIISLSACSVYQKRFGGKSSDYQDAQITDKLQYPVGIQALPASDRYSIPEVKVTQGVVDITPPDYQE